MIIRSGDEKLNLNKTPITNKDMFNIIFEVIKEDYPHVWSNVAEILDYCKLPYFGEEEIIQDEYIPEVIAKVSPGLNEGVYLDCYIESVTRTTFTCDGMEFRVRTHFATLKTLNEGDDAYIKFGALAGLIISLGNRFLSINDGKFAVADE